MSSLKVYRLRRPDLPWGDYGDVLAHGFANLSEDGSKLELQRTGPFVPPITQPSWSYVVVTESFLLQLKGSGLTGYTTIPVVVTKSPKIDWRQWEPYGEKEMKYPSGGEPENYIERRKHSPEASSGFESLTALLFQPAIDFVYGKDAHVVASSWAGTDFFVARTDHPDYNYVSQRGRDWLMEHASEWVSFAEERVR
jgi:hypothetical protein